MRNEMAEELTKVLLSMEKKGWITINENVQPEAIIQALLESIFDVPARVYLKFIRNLP